MKEKPCIAIITVLYNDKNWKPTDFNSKIFNIVVDNTPNQDLRLVGENIEYHPIKKNLGIATAQNIGISIARKLGIKYLLFFDQDSNVSSKMALQLMKAYESIKSSDKSIAAVGPNVFEKKSHSKYKGNADGTIAVKTDLLISSGMFIELQNLDKIGGLDDDLFIDYVDSEWCWRAISKGYTLYKTPEVRMQHQVGKGKFSFCGISYIVSSPIRYYYSFRNFIKLINRTYVPVGWKFRTAVKNIVFLILVLPFFKQYSGNRKQIFSYSFKGLLGRNL